MKILFNKLKKCSKPSKILFLISLIVYLLSLIFFTINVFSLAGIETTIRIVTLVIFYLLLFGYLIGGLITIITKRKKTFIFLVLLSLLFSSTFVISSYYIHTTYSKINTLNKQYVTYTSNMISLKDTDKEKIKTIGMISDKSDIEGYILANKIIENKNIDKKNIKKYDDYYEMLTDLYSKDIDAAFVTSNYSILFSSEELFSNIKNDVSVIYEYSKKMKNKDNSSSDILSSKKLTEPFTVLILGVDSEKDGLNANQAFNGDTLMMITFNPKTLNATMFSIPRDTYVPIACRNNAENKINSAAANGTKCVIDTIENLTDIDIDYYVKINFKGVVDLVNSLGGVNVDVPVHFCEQNSDRLFGQHEICLKEGYQKLDGEQALALARHRKTLPLGDFQRVQHQQLVVEAVAQKAKSIRSVNDFYNVLDSISKNIDTNMTTNKMLSFYNVLKKMLKDASNKDTLITIDHTYLTGSDLMMYNSSTRMNMYTFQYNRSSLAEIVELMKINLEIKKPRMIKTFSFSINETYEQKIAGKSGKSTNIPVTNGADVVPNLVGQSTTYAQNWAKARSINVSINYIHSNDPLYDKSLAEGTIVSQSINAKTAVSQVKSITISVITHIQDKSTETEESPKVPAKKEQTETNVTKEKEEDNTKEDEQETTDPLPPGSPTEDEQLEEDANKDNDKNQE